MKCFTISKGKVTKGIKQTRVNINGAVPVDKKNLIHDAAIYVANVQEEFTYEEALTLAVSFPELFTSIYETFLGKVEEETATVLIAVDKYSYMPMRRWHNSAVIVYRDNHTVIYAALNKDCYLYDKETELVIRIKSKGKDLVPYVEDIQKAYAIRELALRTGLEKNSENAIDINII